MDPSSSIGRKGFAAWLIALLGATATLLLWIGPASIALSLEPVLVTGGAVSLTLWMLVLAKATNRARSEEERLRFEVVRHRETLVEGTLDIEPVTPVRLNYAPAWTVLALGLLVTLAVRFEPAALQWLVHDNRPLLGAAGTAMIWLAVIAGLHNADRARRFALVRAAARRSTHVAVDALEQLPVMVSMCTPDGRRKHFNARYRAVTGKDDDALEGDGWRACVHEDDRVLFDHVFSRDAPLPDSAMQVEYGLHGPDGENRWVRERFVPRFRTDGRLVGYLAAAVDVTTQVQNETELTQEVERLREQVAKVRADSRKTRTEFKSVADERKTLTDENRRLAKTVDDLETKLLLLEQSESELREAVAERDEQIERSKTAATETRQMESQLRAKINRLTTRCQDLGGELEGARDGEAQAVEASEQKQAAASAQMTERTRDLAETLRPQIDGIHDVVEHLAAVTPGDEQLGELESALASTASITAFLDGVLGEKPQTHTTTASVMRPFDLRAAVLSVTKMLQCVAAGRDVIVRVEIDDAFPPTVSGDSVHIREALLMLGTQALHIVDEGVVTIRLSQDATTTEFVATRCTIAHDTVVLTTERLRDVFAVDDTSAPADDPLDATGRFQCAVAWQLVLDMKGAFGFDAPLGDGFAVWFTLNLARRAVLEDLPATPAPTTTERHVEPAAPEPATPEGDRTRDTRRLPQELLTCNVGAVRELGPHSLRLRATKNLADRQTLILTTNDDTTLELDADVVTSEKLGRGKYDVVLRIADVTPALHQRILKIALAHRPLTMRPIES